MASWALLASVKTLVLSGGPAETMQTWIYLFPPSAYLNLGTVDCISIFLNTSSTSRCYVNGTKLILLYIKWEWEQEGEEQKPESFFRVLKRRGW